MVTIGGYRIKQWETSELNCTWETRCVYQPERLYTTESGIIGIQLGSKGMQIRNGVTKSSISFIRGNNALSKSGKTLLQEIENKEGKWQAYNCTLGIKQQKSARF